MSWLIFKRSEGKIYLMAGKPDDKAVHKVIGKWDAHNRTQSSSNGPWPSRNEPYPYVRHNLHGEEVTRNKGLAAFYVAEKFGGQGIHLFDVPGRPGMGIHAGRSYRTNTRTGVNYGELGDVTDGCIRVTPTAMYEISRVHNSGDKLVCIFVKD